MKNLIRNKKKLFYFIIVLGLILGFNHFVSADQVGVGSSLNPLKDINSLEELVKVVAEKIVLPIGSVAAVIFIIWSGFLFVTARGNEEQLTKAKTTFTWTVIGTAVLLGSVVIAEAVVNLVQNLK